MSPDDLEDQASEQLADEPAEQQPAPSYRGGPPLDPQTDFEYDVEKNT